MKKQSGNRKADRHSSWISPVLFIGSSLIAVIILINVLASVTGTTLFHKDQAGEAATDTDTGAMEYVENMTLNAADYLSNYSEIPELLHMTADETRTEDLACYTGDRVELVYNQKAFRMINRGRPELNILGIGPGSPVTRLEETMAENGWDSYPTGNANANVRAYTLDFDDYGYIAAFTTDDSGEGPEEVSDWCLFYYDNSISNEYLNRIRTLLGLSRTEEFESCSLSNPWTDNRADTWYAQAELLTQDGTRIQLLTDPVTMEIFKPAIYLTKADAVRLESRQKQALTEDMKGPRAESEPLWLDTKGLFRMKYELFGMTYDEVKDLFRAEVEKPEKWDKWGKHMTYSEVKSGNKTFTILFYKDRLVAAFINQKSKFVDSVVYRADTILGMDRKEYEDGYEWNVYSGNCIFRVFTDDDDFRQYYQFNGYNK